MEDLKILLVEDDEFVSEKLRIDLEEAGYSVTKLDNGEDAVESIFVSKPDVILMDIKLKGEMTGLEAANRIKEIDDIPVIILTSAISENTVNEIDLSTVDAYLPKSCSFKDINISIMLGLKQHKNRVENSSKYQDEIKKSVEVADMNMRMILSLQSFEVIRKQESELYNGSDINSLYNVFIDELIKLTRAKYGALAIFDKDEKISDFIVRGIESDIKDRIGAFPVGHGLLKKVFDEDDVVRLNMISEGDRYAGLPSSHPVMHCLLGSVVVVNNKKRVAVYLANKQSEKQEFTDTDELVIRLFIPEIKHVLERSLLVSVLKRERAILKKQNETQIKLSNKIASMQDKLLQSERMASIGQLAAGVAHEINNPIGYVSSNFGTLKKYIEDIFDFIGVCEKQITADPGRDNPGVAGVDVDLNKLKDDIEFDYIKQDITDLLRESGEGISRVKKIVQDLKDFSHVDESEWQWADIGHGIDSTLNIVNNEVKYKAKVVKDMGDIPEIECIASQLNQVFMNLLVNAAQAIDEKGVIKVKTGMLNDDWVFVEISDNGRGIKKENIKNIFNPFFTTKPVGKGTGLGLSLSYSIIQKHNGKIEVQSKEGVGTKFIISLPVKQETINDEVGYSNGAG